jgi:hypothetical protein
MGGALGLAVLATLSSTRTDGLLSDGESTASALTGGYHLAFGIAGAVVIAGIGLAVALLRSAPRVEELEPAEEPAELLQAEAAYSEAA